MGRQKTARRFEARYGVSQAALEVEAEHLQREVDDYALLAPADVKAKRVEHRANCESTWKHLCLVVESLPERDRWIVQTLVFRDLWLVLELYKTYLQPACRKKPPASAPPKIQPKSDSPFSEWLFVPQGKE